MAEDLSGDNSGDIPLQSERSQDLSDEDDRKRTKVRLNSRHSDHSDVRDNDSEEDELPFPGFVAKSLRCLTQQNKFRKICLRLLTWSYPLRKE